MKARDGYYRKKQLQRNSSGPYRNASRFMSAGNGDRLSASFVWQEILAFVSWEKGSLYTLARLALAPGKTIHAYLDGDRKRLTNPIRFLLMTCAIVTAAFLFGLPRGEYEAAAESPLTANSWDSVPPELLNKVEEARSLLSEIRDSTEQNFLRRDAELALDALNQSLMSQMSEISLAWMNVFLLFGLPINAVITWVFFRNAKLNLTEHVAANAYVLGVQNIAAISVVPLASLGWVDFGTATLIYMLLSFVYQFVAWKQVFFIRGLARYALGLFAILLSIIGFVLLQGIAMAAIYFLAS